MFYEEDFIKVVDNLTLGVAIIKVFGMRHMENKQPSKKLTLSFIFNIQKQWLEGVL